MANKITPEISAILKQGKIESDRYFLPNIQLDRKVYQECNLHISNNGGLWNRGQKCHLFEKGTEKFKESLELGESINEQQLFQSFYTPLNLVERIVKIANVRGKTVLEPSCGDGRIINECIEQGAEFIDGVELNEEQYKETEARFNEFDHTVISNCDFLKWAPIGANVKPEQYDVAIMNPPFTKRQWILHLIHAYSFVKEGGKIICITPKSLNDKKFVTFVADKRWEFEAVDAGEFKESGTNIATNIVKIWK